MANGVDGVGLTALAVGSILVYAGIKGYSVLAVIENVVIGQPVSTNVKVAHRLTIDSPVTGAIAGTLPGGSSPEGRDRGPR